MDEKRIYQVTYKVYHNERLKKVSFHGKPMYPLYLRLTFDRRTTEYRSNLFDLFMKPKYGIRVSGEIYPPHIERIIEREEKLIEFVIDRHPDDFSLEVFKKEYDYYSRALFDVTLDLKRALKPELYQRLIDQSFIYTPYFALHYFIEVPLRWPLKILTVMEWEIPSTKKGFSDFMERNYARQDLTKVLGQIDEWVKRAAESSR